MSRSSVPPRSRAVWVAGLVTLAIGTLGYLVVGAGVLTSCTDTYDCTESTCAPCAPSAHWLLGGATVQWALVLLAVVVLVLRRRTWVRDRLLPVGVTMLAVSVLALVVSSQMAGRY